MSAEAGSTASAGFSRSDWVLVRRWLGARERAINSGFVAPPELDANESGFTVVCAETVQ
jgi:hypothetical protein